MNTRAKGQRTFYKAVKFAHTVPGVTVLPLYQPGPYAPPQPFDMLLLRGMHCPRFVEVRSNQWGVSKPQTITLARLPGSFYFKQIWMFKDGQTIPRLRQWSPSGWIPIDKVWEYDGDDVLASGRNGH